MAASLKQSYAKILRARANLVMISPDTLEQHRKYALALCAEELPYPFVSDADLEIARRYGLLRKEEHPHGGFYYRSLWVLNRDAIILHRDVPWEGNASVEEYQKLFKLIDSELGKWRATCGLSDPQKLHASKVNTQA
jgi:peroxiredoxin